MGMVAILVMWSRMYEQISIPSAKGRSTWNMVTIGPVIFVEMFETVILWESCVKGQTRTLSSSTHEPLCSH